MGDKRTPRSKGYRAFTEVGLLQAVEEEGSEAAASEHDMSKARQEVEGESNVVHDHRVHGLSASFCAKTFRG